MANRSRTGANRGGRRGAALPMVVVALVGLVGAVGFALDIGMLSIGAQQCQEIADAAVLAGSQELPNHTLATTAASDIATADLPPGETAKFTVTTEFYSAGATIPGGAIAPSNGAMKVTVTKQVDYAFLRILSLNGSTVRRTATAGKVVTGTCIAPMWIWDGTPVAYGVGINLLMADAPNCGIPGNFGFLQPGDSVSFDDALKGTITLEQEELFRVFIGSTIHGYTGLGVGHWRGDLETDSDSRLKRGKAYPYSGDTFSSFSADNPRILIVPFVQYLGGTGSNASFKIIKFGAFWLENVTATGQDRSITGRFIDFGKPGGTGYGLKPTHLMR